LGQVGCPPHCCLLSAVCRQPARQYVRLMSWMGLRHLGQVWCPPDCRKMGRSRNEETDSRQRTRQQTADSRQQTADATHGTESEGKERDMQQRCAGGAHGQHHKHRDSTTQHRRSFIQHCTASIAQQTLHSTSKVSSSITQHDDSITQRLEQRCASGAQERHHKARE
jgi:hypothetical protein